jgi:hypothetical protein
MNEARWETVACGAFTVLTLFIVHFNLSRVISDTAYPCVSELKYTSPGFMMRATRDTSPEGKDCVTILDGIGVLLADAWPKNISPKFAEEIGPLTNSTPWRCSTIESIAFKYPAAKE